MGHNIEKTVVMDFYGIPGSGKTKRSHELADRIRKKGFDVVEPSYELDHLMPVTSRKVRKSAMTTFLIFSHPIKFRRVAKLVRKNGYTVGREWASQIVSISTKLFMLARYNRRIEYLVFDEGLAQAAVSLSIKGRIGADENLEQLLKLSESVSEFHLIQVMLGVDEALMRVNKRNSRDTRIEALRTTGEKEALMKRYEAAVAQIARMEPPRGIIGNDIRYLKRTTDDLNGINE